ncbi:MAG: bifunctional UDP-N-acetylglucosamine diphosphorylase/glucosamine-1-phosphate N-acetyltransferase GlmU [Elusimicrobia bacterium]|nr:bifunctional UDP-N-acetylglucosamine diphosphorylase/glucosamine-1-phosphate N-acetyltransferase GlmU [Elusimicrobiota bacterium]
MPENKNFAAVILAAGLGTRMKSELPKVLHYLGGMSLIERVVRRAAALSPERIIIVTGHKAEMVEAELSGKFEKEPFRRKIIFIRQKLLKGSGRAVQEALPLIQKHAHALVICGDAPLFREATVKKMVSVYFKGRPDCLVMTAELSSPGSYGRIKRGHNGSVAAIVEADGGSDGELAIKEVNSGTYVFKVKALAAAVKDLKKKGSKGEYYLTDALENILSAGGTVSAFRLKDPAEMAGINSRSGLAEAYKMLNERKNSELMASGVTIVDPANTYIDESVKVGRDSIIFPGVFLKGRSVVGKNCRLGPYGIIEDSIIENGCEIKFGCCVYQSRVRALSVVGPVAHLRPASDIGPGAKVGNFSEIKKSRIGKGSKVPHLSYVGDTVMGEKVNVGAGTITCNYDGKNKNKTIIGDGVFIGSNTNLVAPVEIGAGALIAAGSTITDNVPPGKLALARARQVLKDKR